MPRMDMSNRKNLGRNWADILVKAKAIVEGYRETSVTLRQLFYRLVVARILRNHLMDYKMLSEKSAEARRAGTFPRLLDRTRTIHRYATFSSPADARSWLASFYRRDRTEGQDVALYLGVEKHGMVEQLEAWFGDLGVPIVAVGGYSSQSYVDELIDDCRADGRPGVLLYAGDFDPSGEDIVRDFVARSGCFEEVRRVALTADQVVEFDLPEMPGKETDSRAAGFVARHGKLVQVELDALEPEAMRTLYAKAIADYWNDAAHAAAIAREQADRATLRHTSRRRS